MNLSRIVFPLAVLAVITQSAWSQNPGQAAEHGTFGYLDAKTGTFKPLVPLSPEDEQAAAAATVSPTTGKFVFNFTINVVSSFPSSEVIVCGASASVADLTTANAYEELASVVATRSGSKATCTVTIPYSWPLASASQDMVGLSFTVTANSTAVVVARESVHTIGRIKVPSSGSTTSQAISATI